MPATRVSLSTIAAVLSFAVLPALGHAKERNAHSLISRQGIILAPVNATGSVPIKSFNLNKPYPGHFDDPSDPSQRWHLTVNVTTENHPDYHAFASMDILLRPPELGTPGALIQFSGPHGGNFSVIDDMYNTTNGSTRMGWVGNTTANSDWRLTIVRFNHTEWPTVADGNDLAEGACPASIMSARCQEDLRAVFRARPGLANNHGEPIFYTPNILENVTSCERFKTARAGRVRLNEGYTASAQWLISFGGQGLEAYNDYGARTYPLMLIWSNAADLDGQGLPTFDDEHITFACVKADTAVGSGSVLPTGERPDDDEGDGGAGSDGSNNASSALFGLSIVNWVTTLAIGALFLC